MLFVGTQLCIENLPVLSLERKEGRTESSLVVDKNGLNGSRVPLSWKGFILKGEGEGGFGVVLAQLFSHKERLFVS